MLNTATLAAWGSPVRAERPSGLRLIEFRTVVRGTLRGFACVEILAIGMIVDDVPIHVKGDRTWASLPAKPQLDAGRQLVLEPNGKIRHSTFLWWRNRTISDRFSTAVIDLLREAGHRLDGEGPP